MSKIDKKINRLKAKPKDFKWCDVEAIFKGFGLKKIQGDGSRVKFYDKKTCSVCSLHKPHPDPIMKPYAVNIILDFLIDHGYIEDD